MDEIEVLEVDEGEPSVVSLVAHARDRGLKTAVVTASPGPYAREVLKAMGIKVDVLVTGSDGLAAKPDPAMLLAAARALGVPAPECLYVGDDVVDFQAAAAAEVPSLGVHWAAQPPVQWRHSAPDISVSRPSKAIEVFEGRPGLEPVAEAEALGVDPVSHRGSLIRMGGGDFALGRYFPTVYPRHTRSPLTERILRSKSDPEAMAALGRSFASVAGRLKRAPAVVCSVPPAAGEDDRFGPAREAVAQATGARDGAGCLVMNFAVPDYKHVRRDQREASNRERFSARDVEGAEVVLLDDVYNSGSQARACSGALLQAGASSVTILAAGASQDPLREICPRCGEGTLKSRRRGSDGRPFRGCSRYPRCTYLRDTGE